MPPTVDVVIGIVQRGDKVLVCQRPADTSFPGYWEFPGGKREAGESLEECLVRELCEEVDLTVRPAAPLGVIEHDYPAARVRLHPYLCTDAGGDPRPLACQQFRWVDPVQLRDYRFPPANEPLIEEVIARLTTGAPAAVQRASPAD